MSDTSLGALADSGQGFTPTSEFKLALPQRWVLSGAALATLFANTGVGQTVVSTLAPPHAQQSLRLEVGAAAPGEVVPAAGDVGTILAIQDDILGAVPNLANFQPDSILLTSGGDRGFIGRCANVTATNITGVIAEGDPYAQPELTVFEFGFGGEMALPPLAGMTYPSPVWSWSADPTNLQNYGRYESSTPFAMSSIFIDEPCPDEMPRKIWSFFYVDSNGALRVKLPGPSACTGDRYTINLELETCDTTTGAVSRHALILPPTGIATQTSWLTANFWIALPIVSGFSNIGLPTSTTFDASSNELVITIPGPNKFQGLKRKSFLAVLPDPAQYTLFSDTRGEEANQSYGDAADDTTPRPDFDCWADNAFSTVNLFGTKQYDQTTVDRYLIDSFQQFGDTLSDGFVRAAVVEVKIKGIAAQTYTDHIRFGYDQCANATACSASTVTGMSWSNRLENLAAVANQWQPGDEATLCFNLNILPKNDGTLFDTLELFECGDFFDFIVDDDTTVDYARLKVWRCRP